MWKGHVCFSVCPLMGTWAASHIWRLQRCCECRGADTYLSPQCASSITKPPGKRGLTGRPATVKPGSCPVPWPPSPALPPTPPQRALGPVSTGGYPSGLSTGAHWTSVAPPVRQGYVQLRRLWGGSKQQDVCMWGLHSQHCRCTAIRRPTLRTDGSGGRRGPWQQWGSVPTRNLSAPHCAHMHF